MGVVDQEGWIPDFSGVSVLNVKGLDGLGIVLYPRGTPAGYCV